MDAVWVRGFHYKVPDCPQHITQAGVEEVSVLMRVLRLGSSMYSQVPTYVLRPRGEAAWDTQQICARPSEWHAGARVVCSALSAGQLCVLGVDAPCEDSGGGAVHCWAQHWRHEVLQALCYEVHARRVRVQAVWKQALQCAAHCEARQCCWDQSCRVWDADTSTQAHVGLSPKPWSSEGRACTVAALCKHQAVITL